VISADIFEGSNVELIIIDQGVGRRVDSSEAVNLVMLLFILFIVEV
jgi:hypothetical protein